MNTLAKVRRYHSERKMNQPARKTQCREVYSWVEPPGNFFPCLTRFLTGKHDLMTHCNWTILLNHFFSYLFSLSGRLVPWLVCGDVVASFRFWKLRRDGILILSLGPLIRGQLSRRLGPPLQLWTGTVCGLGGDDLGAVAMRMDCR